MRTALSRARHRIVGLSALAPLMLVGAILAQGLDERTLLPVETAAPIRTVVNTAHLLQLDDDVLRVALAEDAVARVQIISSREVLLTGLGAGRTTLFVWLANGRRIRYPLQVDVEHSLDLLSEALRDLDRRISYFVSRDGQTLTLYGEVADEGASRLAQQRADALFLAANADGQVLNWLVYSGRSSQADRQLLQLLREIDPRIAPFRIQVGEEPDPASDTYILRGRVKNVRALSQAVTLAERQLGGFGLRVVAIENQPLLGQPGRQFRPDEIAESGLGAGGGFGAGTADLTNFGFAGGRRAASGLATQVARGLVITSESGRVISLLEVDEIPQVMVSIRVLEVDRTRAKSLGIDFRLDGEKISIGSFSNPFNRGFSNRRGRSPDISGITGGNLRTSYVDDTLAIAAAIDFLEDRQLARSVAEPNVLTLSGEQATVLVGGTLPIPRTTFNDVTVVQSFQFQEFGIRLDIRPTLDDENMVALEVSPSIIRPIGGTGEVPGFQVETVNTTARVDAGQSLIFGGLFSFEEKVDEVRVPVLGVLPIFRWKRRSTDQTELLFIITPRVVEPPSSPSEPVELPGEEGIQFPDLDLPPFPKDRHKREPADEGGEERTEFDPGTLSPDGIPPSMRREVEAPKTRPGPRVRPGNLAGWTVVDEGTDSAPSSWAAVGGALVQSSNVHSPPPEAGGLDRLGTYLVYERGHHWTDYRFVFSVRSIDNDTLGAVFRYQDSNNFYRFEWDRQRRSRRLVKRVGGAFHLLAEDRIAYESDQTYAVEIHAQADSLTVGVDGVTVFAVTDGTLLRGSIGLFSWANEGSVFDDLRVEELPPPLLYEPFGTDSLSRWSFVDEGTIAGASWSIVRGELVQSSPIHAPPTDPDDLAQLETYAVYDGGRLWSNYRAKLYLRSEGDGAIGVMFRYQDADNYYRFSWDRDRQVRRLVKRVGGEFYLLAEDRVAYEQGRTYQVEIRAQGARLKVIIDNATVFSVVDGSLSDGSIALHSRNNRNSVFDSVRVDGLWPPLLWEPFANPGLLRDSFTDARMSGWQVVDEGSVDGPSSWAAGAGTLVQSSNVHAGPGKVENIPRLGTYALYEHGFDWTDYWTTVRLRSEDNDTIGVMFRYQDPDNYYRFSWDQQSGRRLVKRVDGVFSLLAEDRQRYVMAQTYSVAIGAEAQRLTISVDAVTIMSIDDESLESGSIALYSWGNAGSFFESVAVELQVAGWTVRDEGTVSAPSSWAVTGGEFVQSSSIYVPPVPVEDLAKLGTYALYERGGDWTNYRLSVHMRSDSDGAIGVMFRYQDAENYYRFSWDRRLGVRRLVKRVAGDWFLLAQDGAAYVRGQPYQIEIVAQGRLLKVMIDGAMTFSVLDDKLSRGSVALYSWANQDSVFDNVQVDELPAALLTDDFDDSAIESDGLPETIEMLGLTQAATVEEWVVRADAPACGDLEQSVMLRTGPSRWAERLVMPDDPDSAAACLEPGTSLKGLASQRGWIRVRTVGGRSGWIEASYLTPN